jgi:3-hydroxy-9,10-secoandrosta-1,3,5(10)-triene-9,17-dione monooxygenase
MVTKAPPTCAELVRRATELIPLIRKNAPWQEEHRVMHEETLEAVQAAGLLKMRVPARYGGYESDLATVTSVIAELARGDGSVAWTVSVWLISSWQAGLFLDQVQDEIFADPDVRVCASVGPNGIATPTDGGVILNGKWKFISGSKQSQWVTHAVMLATEDGGLLPGLVAVPMSDLTLVDDWYTAGLRGSGSVTNVAENLFVPQERVLNMIPVLTQGLIASEQNINSPVWQGAPFLPFASTAVSAVPYGMALAAREAFYERLPHRKISYTNYEHQADAPLTHFQIAEASVKIDEAEFHVQRAAQRVDEKALSGEPWTLLERVQTRMDMGATCQRVKEAVDILTTASGASAVYSDMVMQRIERDVQTISLHALMHPNTNLELYGRVLCGLEPNTFFL